MKFEDLGLAEEFVRAVRAEGYHTATKIQAAAIPPILQGKDLLGCAQTGTGKTAAFALPAMHRLTLSGNRRHDRSKPIRTLVLAPTRELALQICESFRVYGRHSGLKYTAIYGGVSQGSQVRALQHGVDVLVATPGRLLDLMNQGFVKLGQVEILVLDEADRMLDMGFIHDLRRIVAKTPRSRQTLLFSATMPAEIRSLASQWLTEPVDVRVTPVASTAEKIQQSVYFIEKPQKLSLLGHWLRETAWTRVLVFTKTKHGADKVVRHLVKAGVPADALHGNKSQSARQRALARFQMPKPLVLVATDIAARGLDVDRISHVINFDLPLDPESYVHRVGRTGRAEAAGAAISFCAGEERKMLQSIQHLTRQTLAVEATPAGMCSAARTEPKSAPKSKTLRPGQRRRLDGQNSGIATKVDAPSGRSRRRRSRGSRRATASA